MTPILEETPRIAGREQFHLVVVGHVDHGKSTVVGRLLADSGALPEGKLEQVRRTCERNARPFEYAFLLDALKAEQAQGITIDAARCFFRTARRDYLLNDAPGHVEFLKNMVTGAARAEAALLVIDVHEGIRENTRRHGYLLAMLGLRQVAVVVNKMDLAGYRRESFEAVRDAYAAFLDGLGVRPLSFIPASARGGGNIARRAEEMPWYDGPTVLGQIEAFRREEEAEGRPFRMPVQDVYKFTEDGDDRRIVAGTVESGVLRPGDRVVFHPSGKTARVRTIETFSALSPGAVAAGRATGVTLEPQVFVKPGELLGRDGEPAPEVAARFRASLFWLGRSPLVTGRRYTLKLGAARVPVELARILRVLDASDLTAERDKAAVERHDVAEVVLEAPRPVAFDRAPGLERTGRFVLIDSYEIAGFGAVLEAVAGEPSLLRERVRRREGTWETGDVRPPDRAARNGHTGKSIVFTGAEASARAMARALERRLFLAGRQAYYLASAGAAGIGDRVGPGDREDRILRLGELARVMTDAGLLFITTLPDAEASDMAALRLLNEPYELFVVHVGGSGEAVPADCALDGETDADAAVDAVVHALQAREILSDYVI